MSREFPTYCEYPGFQPRLAQLQQAHEDELGKLANGWHAASRIGDPFDLEAAQRTAAQQYQEHVTALHMHSGVPVLQDWRAAVASGLAIFHDEQSANQEHPHKISRQAQVQRLEDGSVQLTVTHIITMPVDRAQEHLVALDVPQAPLDLNQPTWEARTRAGGPVFPGFSPEQALTTIGTILQERGYRDITERIRQIYQGGNLPWLRVFVQPDGEAWYCKDAGNLFQLLRQTQPSPEPSSEATKE